MRRDYTSLLQSRAQKEQSEEKIDERVDVTEIRYELEDQIAKIQSDIEGYREKKERVCAKVVEYNEGLKVYRRRRNILNTVRGKLYERVNGLRILYERLKLIVKSGNTNLRTAIAALKMSEGLIRTYAGIADKAEDVETQVVEALSNLDTSTSPGSSKKVERASHKRQSALEQRAKQIIEEEEDGLAGLAIA